MNCWPLLLEYKADIHVKNNDGYSLLHSIATKKNSLPFLELLIDHNLDINEQDTHGDTPLLLASDGYADNLRFLLEHNADINIRNFLGETPCHIAIHCEDTKCLELLLSHHPNLKHVDHFGDNVIESVARSGKEVCLRLLLDHTNQNLDTALYVAIENGHKSCAEMLLEHGANINAGPTTVLYYVSRMGKYDEMKWLLEKGADPNVKNLNGERPYHGASLNGHTECLRVLLASMIYQYVD